MNEHYEQEIDLKWLLYRILRAWRPIAFWAILLAIVVGAGKLGKALLEYNGFSDYGLIIPAAFDVDETKFGNISQAKSILALDTLEDYCTREGIKIGIITVPGSAAQTICNRLIKSGVTAIWNFAPCQLEVPEGVTLQQENLALSLAHLKLQMNVD